MMFFELKLRTQIVLCILAGILTGLMIGLTITLIVKVNDIGVLLQSIHNLLYLKPH
jgi:hypothetical protein